MVICKPMNYCSSHTQEGSGHILIASVLVGSIKTVPSLFLQPKYLTRHFPNFFFFGFAIQFRLLDILKDFLKMSQVFLISFKNIPVYHLGVLLQTH